ncbi:MAG: sensor histidine kinase [Schwartzia succinivorans]|jgi:two-component system sensor histidine kinase DegS|nr:sensor histidine kinase [Schwartzia succinivorans]
MAQQEKVAEGQYSAADLGEKQLQNVLQSMVAGIEGSKSQLFDIYEAARREVESSRKTLDEVRRQTREVIDEVDSLAAEEQSQKQKLVHVSANYSEEQIRTAYEAVKEVQSRLGAARDREKQLRELRNQLESQMLHLQTTLQGAERLAMRISSMLNFLSSSLSDVVSQMEAASKNKFLSAAIIRAQEEERLRVSREIHDGPAQGIANVMLEASICERLVDVDTDEAKQSLQTLRRHLKECLSDVRQIIFDLRPMALDDLGLVAAVDQLVHQLHERGLLTVTLTLEGVEVPLEAHVKAALFRIVQEALNNVVHHANVSRASLRMLYTDVAVSILIEDKGEGFDAEAVMDPSQSGEEHFGVLGMRERAMIVGAQFVVSSKPGQGTRVHVRFPLKPENVLAETPEEAARRKRLPRKQVLHEVPPEEEDELTAEVLAESEAVRAAMADNEETALPVGEGRNDE